MEGDERFPRQVADALDTTLLVGDKLVGDGEAQSADTLVSGQTHQADGAA